MLVASCVCIVAASIALSDAYWVKPFTSTPDLNSVVNDLVTQQRFAVRYADFVDCHASGLAYKRQSQFAWEACLVLERNAFITGASHSTITEFGVVGYSRINDQLRYRNWRSVDKKYNGLYAPGEQALIEILNDQVTRLIPHFDAGRTWLNDIHVIEHADWFWHDAKSFSLPFQLRYTTLTPQGSTVINEQRIDIRFYRESIHKPVSEFKVTSRVTLGEKTVSSDREKTGK